VDTKTGTHPAIGQVLIAPPTQSALGASGGIKPANYDPTTGAFEVRDIPPGSYVVIGAMASSSSGTGADQSQMPLTITSADIDNLVVSVGPGQSLNGSVSVEGLQSFSALPGYERVIIIFAPGNDSVFSAPRALSIAPEGTYTVNGILSGPYRFMAAGLPPDSYVKTARIGAIDLLQGLWTPETPASGVLEVVISQKAGQVDATILDKDLKPMRGIQVVLIPDRQRERRDLFKSISSDQNGHITIRGITPGDYKLFAWEDIEPFSFYDPDVLQQYEQKGKAVNVMESSKITVDVNLIPAPIQ
jgi:hypothetical protein